MLANLALKLFPCIREDFADARHIYFLPLHFLLDPVFKTAEMNESHGAVALAGA
jgi:hypothetical protein